MGRWISLVIMLAAIGALSQGSASACAREQVVTPYWSSPPSDLAADEVAIDVDYLGEAFTPSTMSTTILPFLVKRTVAGPASLQAGTQIAVIFEARCRTLMTQTPPNRTNLLVGKMVQRAGRPAVIEPRYRDCDRDDDGRASWSCPFALTKTHP